MMDKQNWRQEQALEKPRRNRTSNRKEKREVMKDRKGNKSAGGKGISVVILMEGGQTIEKNYAVRKKKENNATIE